jgi:hypothetical protein
MMGRSRGRGVGDGPESSRRLKARGEVYLLRPSPEVPTPAGPGVITKT